MDRTGLDWIELNRIRSDWIGSDRLVSVHLDLNTIEENQIGSVSVEYSHSSSLFLGLTTCESVVIKLPPMAISI